MFVKIKTQNPAQISTEMETSGLGLHHDIVRTPYRGKLPSEVTTVKLLASAVAIMKRSAGSLCSHGYSAAFNMSSDDNFRISMSYRRTTALNHSLAVQGKTIFPFDTFVAISHADTGETQTICASEIADRADFDRLRLPDASHSRAQVSSNNVSVIHRLPICRIVIKEASLDLYLRKHGIGIYATFHAAWHDLRDGMPISNDCHNRTIFADK